MLARLYADRLALKGEDSLHVFDTDHPHGQLAHRFPAISEIVDLTKTSGQVRLFDTIIARPDRNYVIDLQASLLERFFSIFHDIAFDSGAAEAGIGVVVYFLVDRQVRSVRAAEHIRGLMAASELILVRNDAIGDVTADPDAAVEYDGIDKDRDLVLPRLSERARDLVETPGFSFGAFLTGADRDVPFELRQELWDFLESIYNQRVAGRSGTTHLI